MKDSEPILSVRDLKVHFEQAGGLLGGSANPVRAVDGVSFDVHPGETVGVVGESGCGKSTTGLAILRMVEPTGGQVIFEGRDITALDRRAMRPIRRGMQMIFQDPFGSLDPRMRVSEIVAEPLIAHRLASGRELRRGWRSCWRWSGSTAGWPRAIRTSSRAASVSASASRARSRSAPA